MDKEDENGGHGYMEFGSIGSAVVQVFYADDNEGCENNDNGKATIPSRNKQSV